MYIFRAFEMVKLASNPRWLDGYRGTRAAVRKSEGASLNPESHEGEGRGGGGMVQSNFPVKILSQFQQTTARIAGRKSHYQASKSLHPSENPSPILPLHLPH